MNVSTSDVTIIGAGPAGAIAGALLIKKGLSVNIIEKQHFPRFSIGESLLPYCMTYIEKAGMVDALHKANFQFKVGAAFERSGHYCDFDFRKGFSKGWSTTYQVQRADFDKLLADNAQSQGANIYYGTQVNEAHFSDDVQRINATNEAGDETQFESRFVLDASGFGRVLPKLLDLEVPSDFPVRTAIFTHIEDNIAANTSNFDREKILISVHPKYQDVWFWLIPFSNGRSSLGVVAKDEIISQYGQDNEEILKALVADVDNLSTVLKNAKFDTPVNKITGYSANVKKLYGKGYALLGNAGEFLDPIFSSGVTIAIKSADLASECVAKQLNNENVDWEQDFEQALRTGIETFKAFVGSWYSGELQKIIFYPKQENDIRSMITSILAGYGWDKSNPYVTASKHRVKILSKICEL